jgi:hypothetical protein
MARENLTQRGTDLRDTEDTIIITKRYLEGEKLTGVKALNTCLDSTGRKKHQDASQGIGARQIADFLSKNNKTVSYVSIAKYLNIAENLIPEIHDIVVKGDASKGGYDKDKNVDTIGVELAAKLGQFPKENQKDLLKATQKAKKDGLSEEKINRELTKYKDAPDEIKEKIRDGEIDIEEIEKEIYKDNMKKEMSEKDENIFIPNFQSRLDKFEDEVNQLESLVLTFKSVFQDKQFRTRYKTLSPDKQKSVKSFVLGIKNKILRCSEIVDTFLSEMPEIKLLRSEKNEKNK